MHVVRRGVPPALLLSDDDRLASRPAGAKRSRGRRRCAVHAYVLMNNHVHPLVTPSRKRSVPHLDFARLAAVGNPLRGVAGVSAALPLECMRYIELNPVRAGLVLNAGDYRWVPAMARTPSATRMRY